MHRNLTILLALLFAFGTVAFAVPARAAITVGVSPSIVELSGKPDSTGSVDLNVLNQGDEPFDVTISSDVYDRAPDRSNPEWLTPNPTTAHIDAGGATTVSVAIAIPKDADPGGHYATIKITTGAPDSSGNSAGISGQLVVPFLITVEGKYDRKAKIEHFAGFLELDGRLGFRAEVSNPGEIHWKPASTLTIKKGDGDSYGTLDVDNSTVFPATLATLSTTSTLPVTAGEKYKAEIDVDYGAKKPAKSKTEFTFTPNFTVSGSVCENLDRGPTITSTFVNSGDLGIISNVVMAIKQTDGTAIGSTGQIADNLIWPSSTVPVATDLSDRLPTGDYVLTVQYQTGAAADPVSVDVPFSIGGTGPNVAPVCPAPSTPSS